MCVVSACVCVCVCSCVKGEKYMYMKGKRIINMYNQGFIQREGGPEISPPEF